MGYQETFEFWKSRLAGTADYQALLALEKDDVARQEAFWRDLAFGTAGMRGELGLGTNRMNVYMVRKATQGLADYIKASGGGQAGVAIAYDSRLYSALFAKETALVLAANGIKAFLYDKLTSVPQLSYTVLQLHCAAGVVITASHNPAKYNGYKVYGPDGGQMANEAADIVTRAIERIEDVFAIPWLSEEAALQQGLLEYIGAALERSYCDQVKTLCIDPIGLAEQAVHFSVVYTPLHGTGYRPITTVLSELGVRHLYVVPEQQEPDGRFPTVPAPNPEMREAFDLAITLADQVEADLILATDPDCDRTGVAVRDNAGQFLILSGNQIGCLLLEYMLSHKRDLAADSFAVQSIVSSPLALRIAAHYGVEMRQVLTGFKYVAEQINLSLSSGQGSFLFGYEESYGYLAGTFVRDKDACIASMLVTDAACYYAGKGMTLFDALQALYSKYGWFMEHVDSFTREGKAGIERIQQAMAALRLSPPADIAGYPLLAVSDYQSGLQHTAAGEEIPLGLPASDVLVWQLSIGSVILRPSGTEPKLKAYISVHADSAPAAKALEAELDAGVRALLGPLLG